MSNTHIIDEAPSVLGTDGSIVSLGRLSLDAESFHAFYRLLVGIRFPLKVSEVLELRFLINHAVDRFHEPALTNDYRYFRSALTQAIDSFGLDNPRHRDRLLRTLALLRELHYRHSVQSRRSETRLRSQHRENRVMRERSLRYGLFFLLAGIAIGIVGLAMFETDWVVKLVIAGCAWFALDFFQSLQVLDREAERFTRELNDVLRARVRELNWKTLIHKLALLLGYKRVPGVEVFHVTQDGEVTGPPQHH